MRVWTPDKLAAVRPLRFEVAGEVAYIAFEAPDLGCLLGSETFVIRGGRIQYQTVVETWADGAETAPTPQ